MHHKEEGDMIRSLLLCLALAVGGCGAQEKQSYAQECVEYVQRVSVGEAWNPPPGNTWIIRMEATVEMEKFLVGEPFYRNGWIVTVKHGRVVAIWYGRVAP